MRTLTEILYDMDNVELKLAKLPVDPLDRTEIERLEGQLDNLKRELRHYESN
jgi:hypothetical protein